ncbi:S41 family peptidase [Deinococcus deserti]|uniref:Putative peptidase n=1 Tax=Deinococcus deserti (strain DSM 17065 / CIP 109153 / LMG 22923 / VCD115) TaxID=546414 RepID=C1CYW7_DEIDV|nr:S41 family peptidase [Deinococcus deserti]ACO47147.1 putative peptidase, precursor [Deinococcus deserti VCD115]
MTPNIRRVHPAPFRSLLGAVLGVSLLLPPAQAQAVSPAQAVFDQANILLVEEYGGLSTVDRVALRNEYQTRLNAVCAAMLATCPVTKAYPVLEAEFTALADKHTFFQTPEDYRDFITSATGGNRRQFGVKLASLDGQNRVVLEVVPESAAAEAGLRRGDVLQTLNNQPYRYDALRTARLNGQTITLGLTRAGQPLTVSISARESSSRDLPRLSYLTVGSAQVGVLRIPTFLGGGGVAQRVHELVAEAQAAGAQGIVVDLRGNGGGSLVECDNSVSAFVPSLTRVARSARGNTRTEVRQGARFESGRVVGAVKNPQLWTGPVAVLVDDGSASCSEFFAYEMQYAKRGPVLGEETAGVGNTATRVFEVGEAAVQLTILNYVKPEGTPYPLLVRPDEAHVQGEAEVRLLTQGVDSLLNAGVAALERSPALGSAAVSMPVTAPASPGGR